MAAVSNNGYALQHASDELKADKEVVKTAIYKNVFALKYASNELKDSLIDKTIRLEHHGSDSYGTVYCLGRIYMSLPQFHEYLSTEKLFDINSTDSLIEFLNSEVEKWSDESGEFNWDEWSEFKHFYDEPLVEIDDWGDIDDLKIYVNEELIATF